MTKKAKSLGLETELGTFRAAQSATKAAKDTAKKLLSTQQFQAREAARIAKEAARKAKEAARKAKEAAKVTP